MIRMGNAWFHDHTSIQYSEGYSDTFIVDVDVRGGLPPGDYARYIRSLSKKLAVLRHGDGCLWVRHNAPGKWFARELKRMLRGIPVPFAVSSMPPGEHDYSFPIRTFRDPCPRPPEMPWDANLDLAALAILRCLARVNQASSKEISSLSGYCLPWARRKLQVLVQMKMVQKRSPDEIYRDRLPTWRITKFGLSRVLRSWAWPPEWYGVKGRRERHRANTGARHTRTARQWPAWVKKAYPTAKIYAGWSEVVLHYYRVTPDALVWGEYEGKETLFWLEVESGHMSGENTCLTLNRRLAAAACYAEDLGVKLVYAILSRPWVCRVVRSGFSHLPDNVAVVINVWTAQLGSLPPVRWGLVTV